MKEKEETEKCVKKREKEGRREIDAEKTAR